MSQFEMLHLPVAKKGKLDRIKAYLQVFLFKRASFPIRFVINILFCISHPFLFFKSLANCSINSWRINRISKVDSRLLFACFFYPGKPDLEYYQYLTLRMAATKSEEPIVIFYIGHYQGPLWAELGNNPEFKLIKLADFSFYGISYLRHYAHKSDVIRLEVLYKVGGAYFDLDCIINENPLNLRVRRRLIMGEETSDKDGSIVGLCNAVVITDRRNKFIKKWRSSYVYFYSKGFDIFWGYHSVRLPLMIAAIPKYNNHIQIIASEKLFKFNPAEVKEIFFESKHWKVNNLPPVIHLWSNYNSKELEEITPHSLMKRQNLYSILVSQMLSIDTQTKLS